MTARIALDKVFTITTADGVIFTGLRVMSKWEGFWKLSDDKGHEFVVKDPGLDELWDKVITAADPGSKDGGSPVEIISPVQSRTTSSLGVRVAVAGVAPTKEASKSAVKKAGKGAP